MNKIPTWALLVGVALLSVAYASQIKKLPGVSTVIGLLPGSDA